MRIKNVQLKDFTLKDVRPFQPLPNKDIDIKWQKGENDNETYASIIANNKHDINEQLSVLSNNIQSERVRTLNNLPKWRMIKTTKERIY